jgi:hypothetical protein
MTAERYLGDGYWARMTGGYYYVSRNGVILPPGNLPDEFVADYRRFIDHVHLLSNHTFGNA